MDNPYTREELLSIKINYPVNFDPPEVREYLKILDECRKVLENLCKATIVKK